MVKLFLFLLLTLQIICNWMSATVIPIKPGFITMYWINGTIKINETDYETNFNLYFKESDKNGVLEAIIRNVYTADSSAAEDQTNPLFQLLYFANRKFYITWDKFNIWLPGEKETNLLYNSLSSYWPLLHFNQDLVETVKNMQKGTVRNLTDIHVPLSTCNYFVQLEANLNSYNIHEKMSYGRPCSRVPNYEDNGTLSYFYYDEPDFEFEIYNNLLKDDLTISYRMMKFTVVNGTEPFSGQFEMVFNREFYNKSEYDQEFSPRPNVLQNSTVDLKAILPFVDGYDLKFKANFTLMAGYGYFPRGYGVLPPINCSFDLYVRYYSYSDTQVYVKIKDLVFHNIKYNKLDTFEEDLKIRLERFAVAGFNDEGLLLYKYLDEDTFEKYIDLHPLLKRTLFLDKISLELMRKQKPAPIEVKVNLTEVKNIGVNCKVRRSYDLSKYETRYEFDSAKTCRKNESEKRTDKYNDLQLEINQRLVPNEFKLIGQSINMEWKESEINYSDALLMAFSVEFYAYVPKSEADEDVFQLDGTVINDEFLNLKRTEP